MQNTEPLCSKRWGVHAGCMQAACSIVWEVHAEKGRESRGPVERCILVCLFLSVFV